MFLHQLFKENENRKSKITELIMSVKSTTNHYFTVAALSLSTRSEQSILKFASATLSNTLIQKKIDLIFQACTRNPLIACDWVPTLPASLSKEPDVLKFDEAIVNHIHCVDLPISELEVDSQFKKVTAAKVVLNIPFSRDPSEMNAWNKLVLPIVDLCEEFFPSIIKSKTVFNIQYQKGL